MARRHSFNDAALYGESLAARAVMTLLLRAVNLRHDKALTLFCETEQEARAGLVAQIQRLPRDASRPTR